MFKLPPYGLFVESASARAWFGVSVRNHKRRKHTGHKLKEFVPWRGTRNGSASNALCPSSGPLYCIPLCCTPTFPTGGAPGAHIPACDAAALPPYNSSVWLRYCASASSVLLSILPAALCSRSSTLAGSLSSIHDENIKRLQSKAPHAQIPAG